MPQTQVSCPRCRQPVPAQVEQLFDVTHNPEAKQRLLSGASNYVRCPYCGFQGRLATPIVYHDNEKELLLTYFPPELGLSVNDQERMIGPLIKQVMDRLPPERRKAYLFNPQTHFTYESLIETILAKDGITPEMLKAQQERVYLIERLLQASAPDVRAEIIKQNDHLCDEQLFALFSRLIQSAAQGQQTQLVQTLTEIQDQLIRETTFGRRLSESVNELEIALESLKEAGERLTREKLLDLVSAAPNDARLRAYVSLARNGMDYVFFQMLSERIERAAGEERKRLEELREKLLDYTNEIDRQIEARYKQAKQLIDDILKQDDIAKATHERLPQFTQEAVDIVQQQLRQASEKNDYVTMGKLQKIIEVLREASAPPPEVALIEQLLDAPNEATVEKVLQENESLVNDQFMAALNALIVEMEAQAENNPEAKALGEKLSALYKTALRFSMKKQIGRG